MAPHHILVVKISSVIPENLVLLTESEQSWPQICTYPPNYDP